LDLIGDRMEEIVIYGSDGGKTVTNTSHATDQFVTACDLHTGSHLWTYKKSSSPMHGLVANDQYIFANQVGQAQLFIYTHGRETFSQKLILPERVGCISVSPKGNYLAVGGDTGRLLIWGLRTGKLILAQDTHYQGITSLQFTQDDAYLFSGGNDARVFGWNMTDVVNLSLDKSTESVQPALTLTDHSLAITDIVVGYGKCTEARVFTCSLDQTVRCWDLVTGQLLTTFVLSEKIHSIAVDPMERAIYAGLSSGIIQVIPLYNQNKATGAIEAVGGARRIITIEPEESNSLAQHTSIVTCLSLSFDAALLVSGDDKGQVLIWDLASKQVTRRPKQHRGSVSSIQIICRKKDLHPNKMVSNANTTNQLPILERTLTTSGPQKDDVWIQIKDSTKDQQPPSQMDILKDVEIAKSQAAQFSGENTQSGLQAKVQQLETDLSQLYQHYSNLKSVHEDLWKLHVKNN
jgi:pre-rRNA-processing protein IPI3